MKLQEINELLKNNPSQELLEELAQDQRKSVQKALQGYYKQLEKAAQEKARFEKMTAFEKRFYGEGCKYIAGVDEAGRGPLAGPLAIASVILPENVFIPGLNDSKKLSAAKRDQLYDEILAKALAVSVNIVSVANIDKYNIYAATMEGMKEVINHLSIKPEVVLIDAMPVKLANGIKPVPIIHGDAVSISIAAASIIAKVTRDRIMLRLAEKAPHYALEQNMGYGTKAHMEGIAQYGVTDYHRRSYEPIKSMHLEPVEERANELFSPLEGEYIYKL